MSGSSLGKHLVVFTNHQKSFGQTICTKVETGSASLTWIVNMTQIN